MVTPNSCSKATRGPGQPAFKKSHGEPIQISTRLQKKLFVALKQQLHIAARREFVKTINNFI
jgi:hypothetical protein